MVCGIREPQDWTMGGSNICRDCPPWPASAGRASLKLKVLTMLGLVALFAVGCPAIASAQAGDSLAPPEAPIAAGAIYETVPIEIYPGAVHVDWTVGRSDPTVGCAASAWI